MDVVYGLTGTPGTGKKTLAPLVAGALGITAISLNDLARSYGLVGEDEAVDIPAFRRNLYNSWGLEPRARSDVERDAFGTVLFHGHFLPYVFTKEVAWNPRIVQRAVVLRTEPSVLKGRLQARGYPAGKVTENVEAELIGVVSSDAFDAFGDDRTAEVDTTNARPESATKAVADFLSGKSKSSRRIDWTLNYGSAGKLRSLLSVDG